jgi:hypothetical protein
MIYDDRHYYTHHAGQRYRLLGPCEKTEANDAIAVEREKLVQQQSAEDVKRVCQL